MFSQCLGPLGKLWAEVCVKEDWVLFISGGLVGAVMYSWCLTAFYDKTGLTFELASRFFDPNIGGSTCARTTAGFFASVLALSYLDPFKLSLMYSDLDNRDIEHAVNNRHGSGIWAIAVIGLGGFAGVGGAAFII